MVAALQMPVLADLLAERAGRLHEMSVEQIRQAISTDGVSQVMAAAGQRLTSLGENEVEEGMMRLAISNAASEKSAAMSKTSEESSGIVSLTAPSGVITRESVPVPKFCSGYRRGTGPLNHTPGMRSTGLSCSMKCRVVSFGRFSSSALPSPFGPGRL